MAEIAKGSEEAFLISQIGKTPSVLFETAKGDVQEGYTENYTRVRIKSKNRLTGRILPVLITGAENEYCTSELL